MLGSRFLGDPLAGGMPTWKYVSNRFLTTVENIAFGLHLSEYHTGLRAYSRQLLETIPYHANSDDFVFDQELIAQVVAAGMRDADRRDRGPDPLLRGGELGRLPAQRRVRPVDAARRRAVPAPSPPAPTLEEADRARGEPARRAPRHPWNRDQHPRRVCAAAVGRRRRRHRRAPPGRPRGRRADGRVAVVLDVACPRRALALAAAPHRARRLPARARLHVHRLPRQQRPAGPARRAGTRAMRSARAKASSRTTVLGTVVVERDRRHASSSSGLAGPRRRRPRRRRGDLDRGRYSGRPSSACCSSSSRWAS